MDGGSGGGVVAVVGRAEIDTRAPFKSVKEAVALFGERVLAGELCAGGRRINAAENQVTAAPRPAVNRQAGAAVAVNVAAAPPPPRHIPPAPARRELEDAKHELQKEREEKHQMAGCILSLQEELSSAMRELKKLKARDEEDAAAKVIDLQMEDLKFMEINNQHLQQRHQSPPASSVSVNMAAKQAAAAEFQKKRYVTFADPPTAAYDRAPSPPDVVMELHHRHQPQYAPAGRPQYREVRFQRQASAGHETVRKVMAAAAAAEEEGRKKKKKPLIPLVGALFMRKKKSSPAGHNHDDGSSAAVKPRPSF